MQNVNDLNADIRRTLEGVTNRRFLVFHPAWGYFARDYNLQMLAIEVGGQEPSAAELADLIQFAQQQSDSGDFLPRPSSASGMPLKQLLRKLAERFY